MRKNMLFLNITFSSISAKNLSNKVFTGDGIDLRQFVKKMTPIFIYKEKFKKGRKKSAMIYVMTRYCTYVSMIFDHLIQPLL